MNSRTTKSTVSFAHPFAIGGGLTGLPAGDYEVVVDEELLPNLSFKAYRRTATYILVKSRKAQGSTQMYPIDPEDLRLALSHDQERCRKSEKSEAALIPQEGLK